jgi:hypothetical protein
MGKRNGYQCSVTMRYMWPVGFILAEYMRLGLWLGVFVLVDSKGVPISEIRRT